MKVGLLDKFIKGRKNSLPENIIICIVTALAGTFYFYECYYGEKIHAAACLFITAAIAVTWIICSVCSGRDGKLGFLIFAFLYWSVPYIYILWYETRDNLHEYNKWLAMSNKIAKALLINPFEEAAERTGISAVTLAAVLLLSVMVTYIVGFLIKRHYEAKSASGDEKNSDDYNGEYVLDEGTENETDDE
jgi:hypothetical protein